MIPADLIKDLIKEHDYAIEHFKPYLSAHEGLAVIWEEFEELKEEVFINQKHRSIENMSGEALQVAVTALRFIIDVCKKEE